MKKAVKWMSTASTVSTDVDEPLASTGINRRHQQKMFHYIRIQNCTFSILVNVEGQRRWLMLTTALIFDRLQAALFIPPTWAPACFERDRAC